MDTTATDLLLTQLMNSHDLDPTETHLTEWSEGTNEAYLVNEYSDTELALAAHVPPAEYYSALGTVELLKRMLREKAPRSLIEEVVDSLGSMLLRGAECRYEMEARQSIR